MKIIFTKLLMLVSIASYSQLTFERIDLNESLDGISSIHSADFDNDGDNDIFTASRNDNRVVLFERLNDGNLFLRTLTNDLAGASVVKSFDLDMDGDLDIIASGSDPGNHSICWWENVNNNFSSKKTIVNINNQAFQDFDVADLDNDGDNDIISVEFSTASGPGSLAMWENENLSFTFRELSDNCIDGRQINITDWDDDNDLDFIISEGLGDKLTYWENTGNLNFIKNTFFNQDLCTSFDIADLDGDGDKDFVSLSFTGDEVSYWLNDGNDNFSKFLIEDDYDGPDKVLFYDMDKDSDLDIVASFYNEDLLVIYENDGSMNFSENIIDDDFDSFDIFIADLDNDNSPDILGASLSDDKAITWISNLVVSTTTTSEANATRVFPTPTDNLLYIENNSTLPINYQIVDQFGRISQTGNFIENINVEKLSSGIYYLQLFLGNLIETHKIIITKS